MGNDLGDIYLLVGVGVGGAVVGSLLTYILIRGKISSLKDSLENAKRRIDKLEEEREKFPYRKKPKEPSKALNFERSTRTPIKEKPLSKAPLENKAIEEEDILDKSPEILSPTIPTTSTKDRLEDLKSLSKVVEEVESLTMPEDIFGEIDEIDLPPNPTSFPVFDRHFEETPNIKREDFKKFANKKVLVAEDNPVNSKLIALLFSKSGIDVDIAENGIETINKLKEALNSSKPYDLVLMDVHMPKMDGLEATMTIREDPEIQDIPILALTASTDQEEVEKILESGMNGFLSKPIKLGKVYTAFNIFLNTQNQTQKTKTSQKQTQTPDQKILDIQKGIEHTNHDKNLYKAILSEFLKNYSNSDKKFRDYIKRGDFESLRSLVVDLEGLTGTIGADELYSILRRINSLLVKKEFNELQKTISTFQNSLGRLTTATKAYLGV
jgi:CheY-like chemotaxis protein